jgi:RNA polymerase sigma factor (sigma-70 family)
MRELADIELLREYVGNQSEEAFALLVERHLNLVYASALRQVRDPYLAEEVAQTVFTILAQKAAKLGKETVISGWLYRTTRFASIAAVRTEQRRHKRETQFMHMETMQTPSDAEPEISWEKLTPLLDDALHSLGDKDRNAIVLHYLEKKSLRDVGQALGTTEDAAQKRVSRAVEKLRSLLARRTGDMTLAALTALLSGQTIQAAPAGLAGSIASTALLQQTAVASTTTLIENTLKLMFLNKLKIVLTGAAAALLALGIGSAVLPHAFAAKSARPELQGAWQGELDDNGRKLRMVLKISKSTEGAYLATLDSIEQGAAEIPVSEIAYSNTTVRLAIKSLQGTFDGQMDSKGSEIVGNWQQFKINYPLTLKRTDKPATLNAPLPMSAYLPRAGSDLQGYWVGNLPAGEARLLRIAVKISEPTNGPISAVFDIVDQGLRNLPVVSIDYTKPDLSFDMAASKAHFEGELNAAGNEISGEWRQWRGKPVPLVLVRSDPAEDKIKTGSYAYTSETDLQGIWAGLLKIGQTELHLLLKIGKTGENTFTSTLDSIDQGAKDIPTTTVTLTNSEVQLHWRGLGASYYGQLKDGKLIGNWQQGATSFELEFGRTNVMQR